MSRKQNRRLIAEIITRVLTEQMSVREALLLFPKNNIDPSIQCAWHALVHYEADEELRAKDIDYKEEQDDFLYFLSNVLREGNDLPANIIEDYIPWHGKAPIQVKENSFWSKVLALLRFINIG